MLGLIATIGIGLATWGWMTLADSHPDKKPSWSGSDCFYIEDREVRLTAEEVNRRILKGTCLLVVGGAIAAICFHAHGSLEFRFTL